MLKKILTKVNKQINALFVTLSLATMVFTPVAMGAEAERLSKKQAESIIQELGLNKSITLNEFYKKNKYIFPERIQKQMEILVKKFGNEKMPTIEVATSQGKGGETIPVLRLTSGKQLMNIQITGDERQYAKFDNVSLMAEDIVNFDDMFLRLYNGDHNNRKKAVGDLEAKASKKIAIRPKIVANKNVPHITDAAWKKLSAKEKVKYIYKMRAVWESSKSVLEITEKNKSSSKKDYSFNLIDWLLFTEAIAAGKRSGSCIVLGYVSTYKNNVCSIDTAISSYKSKPIVEKAQKFCATKKAFACSPEIFGTPNGEPTCIAKSDPGFQYATTSKGLCETSSRLASPNDVQFLNDPNKKLGRYSEGNELEGVLAKIKKENNKEEEENIDKFYADLVKFAGDSDLKDFTEKPKILGAFNAEIELAVNSCRDAAEKSASHENKFWDACDQLHRRKLSLKAEADQQCKTDNGQNSNITENNTCSCPAVPAPTPPAKPPAKPPIAEAPVGESCKAPQEPITDKLTEKEPAKPTEEVAQGGQRGRIVCKSNEERKIETSPLTQSRTEKCIPIKDLGFGFGKDDSQGDKKSNFWGGFKSIFVTAAPWLLGALVLFGVYKLWSPKKPDRKSAADFCPNGTRPPCGMSCPAPQAILSSGVCGCTACPPGQTISDQSSCSCTTTTSVSIITCADGMTQVSDISQCPTETNYTCWNGSVVTNPINCPTQPVTKPAGVGTER